MEFSLEKIIKMQFCRKMSDINMQFLLETEMRFRILKPVGAPL